MTSCLPATSPDSYKREAGCEPSPRHDTLCVTCPLLYTHMTVATVQTFDILGHEFDMDALNDIATHGCAAGVSGFIYSSELADVFDKHEEDIWNFLDDTAYCMDDKSGIQMVIDTINDDFYTMQDIKEKAVWLFVELFAVQLLQRNGHPDWV